MHNTMYQPYKKRAPRKRTSAYFMPFLIILILVGIIFASWSALNRFFVGANRDTLNERVHLSIESGSAKAMTAGKGEWKSVPDDISLYADERVQTGSEGRVALTFFDESVMRLDDSTEVYFEELKKKNESVTIRVGLDSGSVWTEVNPILDPSSSFVVATSLLEISASEGIFAVEAPGTVYMIKGSSQVSIMDGEHILKSVRLGVGQQLVVDDIVLGDLKEGKEAEVIFAMDDLFKESNWYRWNMEKDGVMMEEGEMDEETDVEGETEVDGGEGVEDSDDGVSSNKEVSDTETVNDENDEDEEKDPDLLNDKTPPTPPVITNPKSSDGGSVEIDDIAVSIEGTVDADTAAVIVNDYQLGKFVFGDRTFRYTANIAFDNLRAGENEYEVYAKDKAGNLSEVTTLILILPQSVVDEKKAEAQEELEQNGGAEEGDDSALPAAQSSGGVKITSPNEGENLSTSETSFEIKGVVPADTAKVLVNDYKLGAFKAGDTSFLYRASSSLGNLVIGQKNTYTAKAYDEDDELIGSASITIDVEGGDEAAPVITLPVSQAVYTTTLNEVVLGGTVGKWATRIAINGQNLSEYIPGSQEWKKAVTLEPGKNTFTVSAEKDGVKTGEDSIVITYQP